MEEKTDMEELRDTYLRMHNLVNFAAQENEIRLREYTHELYMHSVRKVEPDANKKKNIQTKIVASLIDNDDGLSTKKLIEELEGVASREYEPIQLEVKGLNDEEMQRNHMVFMSLVERAKRDGNKRVERLKESFDQMTAHQKQIMRQAVDDYRQHRGFHRLKNRILELENQLSKQRTLLAERKYQYDVRKAESNQSAEELRARYEAETEELIRTLLITIDSKQQELEILQRKHEEIRKDIDGICKDLSVVLHDIDKEEKSKLGKRHGRRTHINSKAKQEQLTMDDSDNESVATSTQAKKDTDEVTIMDVFPFIKVGELTDDMIQQTFQMVDESSSIVHSKQTDKEYAEQKLAMKKSELMAVLKSEESKALERLKKMVIGLETKIDSDEKRAALLESLVKNLEQDSKSGGNKSNFKGIGIGSSKGSDVAASNKVGILNRRSQNLAYNNGSSGYKNGDNAGPNVAFDDENNDTDDVDKQQEKDDEEDDIDTGGNPADIERRHIRKLEKDAKKRMEELKKKGITSAGSAISVATDSTNSLSFDANDSSKFQALQAKFLKSSQPSRQTQSPPKEISFGVKTPIDRNSNSAQNKSRGKESGLEGTEEPAATPNVSQRFIAPSQLTKIMQTIESFDRYIRPPVWALGPSNVLIPYSQRPVLPSNDDAMNIYNNNGYQGMSSSDDAAGNRVPFSVKRIGGGEAGKPSLAHGPAPPPGGPRGGKAPGSAGLNRLMIEAHAIDVSHPHYQSQQDQQPRTLTQRLEDQLLASNREEQPRLLSREEKAKLAEEKVQQDYFMQSYGFHLALDQLQMLMELLTHWGGTAPEQTTLDNLKEVLSPSKGGTNILMGVMKVRTEEEELEDLERMRHQTQEVLLSLKHAYRQNKSLHHVLKDTTRSIQHEVRRCDEIKRQLFTEVQGLRWDQHLQPGQYQQEMKELKERILVLKDELKLWETKIRQQSKSNSRMSQALTDETTARKISEGIADKLRQQQKQQVHTQVGMSSLSSINGRSLGPGVSTNPNRSKMAAAASSIMSQRGMQQWTSNIQHQKSQSSIATGVSAASSSILEELSDMGDEQWSTSSFSIASAMKDPSTVPAKSKSASISTKKVRISTTGSIVEQDDSSASSLPRSATTKTVTQAKKQRENKSLSGSVQSDSEDAADIEESNTTANVPDEIPQRGSALESDDTNVKNTALDRRSLLHDFMTKPSRSQHTIHRQNKYDDEDDDEDSHKPKMKFQRPRHDSSEGQTIQTNEHTEKLKLYHDASDIYAQAMKDLSESQKKSR